MKSSEIKSLHSWYLENRRPLPWRKNRKAYNVWISETMLQQTTTTAVIPYYKRFMESFPTLESLARAPEPKVIKNWAGLGYYSRARNLHKAAKLIVKDGGFAKTADELIKYPGFGPYTSRAVSSIAFGEKVGVLDGNVIRILSRKMNWKLEWWKTTPRKQLQELADQLAQDQFPSHEVNQAMMELGATICTPKAAHCTICPWLKGCQSQKNKTQYELPLKKAKVAFQDWVLKTYIVSNKDCVLLIKNDNSPFLKGQWTLPFEAKQLKSKPSKFDFKHNITKYNIYVQINPKTKKALNKSHKNSEYIWVKKSEVGAYSPSSLVTKTLKMFQEV